MELLPIARLLTLSAKIAFFLKKTFPHKKNKPITLTMIVTPSPVQQVVAYFRPHQELDNTDRGWEGVDQVIIVENG